ncbi:hypothetical protein KY290_020721 [Solanum tuberosum]|uniref:Uncharacterized protein n=1 Tax=Solanum tuberosum TaxID=4113 RepID=A0ABQ7V0G2_SOLTU|nr:hypothetical protein KY290_020721 [Solanum tuberosum]
MSQYNRLFLNQQQPNNHHQRLIMSNSHLPHHLMMSNINTQPPYQIENHQFQEIPNYIPRNHVFQNLTNPYTPFDTNYITQNHHLLTIFPHAVQTSPYATWEGMLNLNQNDLNPTPLPNIIEERMTNSLIRLASTQLELTQEQPLWNSIISSTTPTTLSNLNLQQNQAYTPTELLCQLLIKRNTGHAQSKSGIRGHDVQRRGPRYEGPSGSADATRNTIVPYEPSCHISNERRGTKHARSSYSNPLLEEPIDFGHAPKYRKEIPSQSATSSEDNIHFNTALQLTDSLKLCSYNHSNFEGEASNGWGEPNQARFKCEPRNVVDARRELQLTGRYNDEDATLEL